MELSEKKLFDANSIKIESDVSNIDSIIEYEQILLSISKKIMTYRKENNLTQKELAHILNVNQVMISKLERGNYNPTMKLLYNISRRLTKSSDLFVDLLKDIIDKLHKNENIGHRIQFKQCEKYNYNKNCKQKDNIIYYVKEYKNDKEYGGSIYGKISNAS